MAEKKKTLNLGILFLSIIIVIALFDWIVANTYSPESETTGHSEATATPSGNTATPTPTQTPQITATPVPTPTQTPKPRRPSAPVGKVKVYNTSASTIYIRFINARTGKRSRKFSVHSPGTTIRLKCGQFTYKITAVDGSFLDSGMVTVSRRSTAQIIYPKRMHSHY